MKYSEIAAYMKGEALPEETAQKIEKLHRNAAHKFYIPVYER